MNSSAFPAKFPIPFANGAGGSYIRAIPTPSQTATATDAPASLTDGFPPITFTPVASGGIPPAGRDLNGILNQLSAWARLHACGVFFVYDATFSTAIGGYPKGSILASTTDGLYWRSTIENNGNNPDTGGAGWVVLLPVKATPAETQAGTDNTKFITPYDLASAGYIGITAFQNQANNGYRVYSDGFIECWGSLTVPANTDVTVTLPRAHTTWVVPTGSGIQDNFGEDHPIGISGVIGSPPTGFRITNAINGSSIFYWHTKGY